MSMKRFVGWRRENRQLREEREIHRSLLQSVPPVLVTVSIRSRDARCRATMEKTDPPATGGPRGGPRGVPREILFDLSHPDHIIGLNVLGVDLRPPPTQNNTTARPQ